MPGLEPAFRGEDRQRTSLIVCSHLEGEGHFRSSIFNVKPVVCRGDFCYWQGLNEHWDSHLTLVNVEHDVDVTDRHIRELLDCPHPLCSFAYECHWQTTGSAEPLIAAGTGDWQHHLTGGEEWADWSALGLVKLTPQARARPLECRRWAQLEMAVHRSVKPPWHIHWPLVDHWHF